ncbi:MAG: heme-binding beta-barrel domain-containing protein [Pseudomonadota bacterium]
MTEQKTETSKDTVIDGIDYGPLAGLMGRWRGSDGMDISPEPDDTEMNPYYETITFTPADDVDNAETQELAVVHYHQIVARKRNDKVFHNESGYWLWDKAQDLVMVSFAIPRGLALVAGGQSQATAKGMELHVEAAQDHPDWPISQSPFLRERAKTLSFERRMVISDNQILYQQTTKLDIYGRQFDHTDENTLHREAD